ncbi:MAG TPA: ketopantoate reductase family protein [Steroidobacteraceae bacterium]|jgi:2-dehydropantoate 2-reductase|nr:ketopantoate reductase family protein [Steroidobacteraceae bacterium]
MQTTATESQPTARWPGIAIVGAGAVGAYFGARLARAGAPVVMIGRTPFVEAVGRHGLTIEAHGEALTLRVPATTELSACREAQLVLLCVKTIDTVSTARALEPYVSTDAVLVTMQNGVESAEQVRGIVHCDTVPAVVYVAVAMPSPGRVQHFGRGDLVMGTDPASRRVAAECVRAGIPCRVTENIEGELWTKLLMNCALNALSALGRSNYAHIIACPPAHSLMERVVTEFMQVAAAARVRLPAIPDIDAAMDAVTRLVAQMPGQHSSMAQDLARGRRTEVGALNGYIQRRAAQLGLQAPANQALCALITLIETAEDNP